MTISVMINGTERSLAEGSSIVDALAALDLPRDTKGVAVAVNAQVVPRDQWEDTMLAGGAQIEVVRAAAGG